MRRDKEEEGEVCEGEEERAENEEERAEGKEDHGNAPDTWDFTGKIEDAEDRPQGEVAEEEGQRKIRHADHHFPRLLEDVAVANGEIFHFVMIDADENDASGKNDTRAKKDRQKGKAQRHPAACADR